MVRALSFLSILVLASAVVAALPQEGETTWEVPEEAKAVKNPVENTPEVVAAGAELYKKNCLMCHGEAAKGDGPATQFIKPSPPDISTTAAKERMTDGEVFYKITNGKRPMPPMQRKMSEEERWQVVHYLRTLQVN